MNRFRFGVTILSLTAILCFLGSSAIAQEEEMSKAEKQIQKQIKGTIKVADKLFATGSNLTICLDLYKQVIIEDPRNYHAMYQLAECYRYLRYYNDAEKWYYKLGKTSADGYDLLLFHLATMMQANGKYKEAKVKYSEFIRSAQDVDGYYIEKAQLGLKSCQYAQAEINKGLPDDGLVNLGSMVNDLRSDFSMINLTDDRLLYTTTVYEKHYKKVKLPKNELSSPIKMRYDTVAVNRLYELDYENGRVGEALPYYIDVPSDYANVGSPSLSEDKERMYITMRIPGKKNGNNFTINKATRQSEDVWSKFKPMGSLVNASGASTKNPHIVTVNGTEIMFFSSNRGGEGGFDIFYSTLDEEGKAMQTFNLGPVINSKGDEVTPFYDLEAKRLYYSSDGMLGFGQLDVYYVEGDLNEGWSIPVNYGASINTGADEYYFSLIGPKKEVFVSSNRPGGKNLNGSTCCDDIYKGGKGTESGVYKGEPEFTVLLNVYDKKSKKEMQNLNISVVNTKTNDLLESSVSQQGTLLFVTLKGYSDFNIRLGKDGYDAKNLRVSSIGYTPGDTLFNDVYMAHTLTPEEKAFEYILDHMPDAKYPEMKFHVQIGAYSKPKAYIFKDLVVSDPVREVMENNLYKYLNGSFDTARNIEKLRQEIVTKGVSDAFVVAYYKGSRILMNEAKELLETPIAE